MSQLKCVTCGDAFTFTDRDTSYYKSRELSKPTHCSDCRKMRKLMPVSELLNRKIPTVCSCCCPICGVLHDDLIEIEHRVSDYAWRVCGYLMVLCSVCQGRSGEVFVVLRHRRAVLLAKTRGPLSLRPCDFSRD